MKFSHFLRAAIISGTLAVTVFSNIGEAQSPQETTPQAELAPCAQADQALKPTCNPSPRAAAKSNDTQKDGGAERMSFKKMFTNLPGDQKTIWTSPFQLRTSDLPWVIPFATSTRLLIANDQSIMLREQSSPSAIRLSDNIANGGTAALVGFPALMYGWGSLTGSSRARETGLLTGESLINSFAVAEALSRVFGRERPTLTDGQGKFFQDFSNPSFPSDHSMLSWTAASVIAHEYPGWLSQTLAYGTASAVSIARVTGRKHFPSDVVVGGVLGWLIGRQVYNRHHDPALDDGDYGSFIPEERHFSGPQTGTTFVSIDSWVYPDLDRFDALGYIDTAVVGLRPWTRTECARLVEEAGQAIALHDSGQWAPIYARLAAEFAPEIKGQTQPAIWLEDAYTRIGFLSGSPLTDDYHFAKTFTDDFGRPFGSGVNNITGASARAIVGPFAFYVRGEYQHAGTVPPLSAPAQQAIVSLEGLPFLPAQRTDSLDRFRLLDAYASFTFHNNVVSFGNQTLWWGPRADGPFLASNNAEPLPMLRISRATPFVLPWVFRLIGAIRIEAFWGQLEGQQFVGFEDTAGNRHVISAPLHPHPFIQGVKFSFKPTRNLEFGVGATAILSGPGFPLTLHSLLRSYSPTGNTIPGEPTDPGDRRSAFDFSYRVPWLRDWLSFYGDSFTEDEYSPISFPRKSAFRIGLYMPRIPKIEKLDLRAEGIYTDIPDLQGVGVSYFNGHYLSGYTNYGQIIGNAIGRESRGWNTWATYHFNADDNLQFHYRNQHVNPAFLEGGYLRDFDLSGTVVKWGSIVFTGTATYQHWNFPLLSAIPKSNLGVSLQVSFQPSHGLKLFKNN